jgi:hypothetical protein
MPLPAREPVKPPGGTMGPAVPLAPAAPLLAPAAPLAPLAPAAPLGYPAAPYGGYRSSFAAGWRGGLGRI